MSQPDHGAYHPDHFRRREAVSAAASAAVFVFVGVVLTLTIFALFAAVKNAQDKNGAEIARLRADVDRHEVLLRTAQKRPPPPPPVKPAP